MAIGNDVRRVELIGIRNFVCRGTNLVIDPGELLVLLGPNGAGKTTLLNVIAGLVSHEGAVRFDGQPVDLLPARERQVGYVFQDLVLFPHLDVAANIAYGLQNQRSERVEELLQLMGIDHLRTRYPATLSGGEKQRVALARALAPRPKILLLDEPFSSLDDQSSRLLRAELKQLQRDLGMTTVFVTHDLLEAEQIADRIAVIKDGVVEQIGTSEEVFFASSATNVFECTEVRSLGHGLAEADCSGLNLVIPKNGEVRRVFILSRDVAVSLERPVSGVNVFAGTVQEIGQSGICVEVCGNVISAELPFSFRRVQPGSEVFVELSFSKLRVS